MNSNESRKTEFARHYEHLELDDKADWDTVREKYRSLVNLWHPDRYAQRPGEQIHAQQQFIDVTKSYKALQNFYRTNERMPFQSSRVTSQKHSEKHNHDASHTVDDIIPSTEGTGILGRDKQKNGLAAIKPHRLRNILFIAAVCAMMLGTILLFLILDRKAHQAVMEKGREIVKEAPESDFRPSASEIRKSQTRGAFVKPTQ
ncbi:J domain-containing protein [Granulosicoccus sp.]|nr:J domain-containing protein [Granulosicoccus sp.]